MSPFSKMSCFCLSLGQQFRNSEALILWGKTPIDQDFLHEVAANTRCVPVWASNFC